MKKLLVLSVFFMLTCAAYSQNFLYKVNYAMSVEVEKTIPVESGILNHFGVYEFKFKTNEVRLIKDVLVDPKKLNYAKDADKILKPYVKKDEEKYLGVISYQLVKVVRL